MALVAACVRIALAIMALRGIRWAYIAFIAAGLAYFPSRAGFHLTPRPCEIVFGARLAIHSFSNFPHIVLFSVFFVFSSTQTGATPSDRYVLGYSAIATFIMGMLVEIAEGVSGVGNCRARDLIPDTVGIFLGSSALIAWRKMRRSESLNPFVGIRRNSR